MLQRGDEGGREGNTKVASNREVGTCSMKLKSCLAIQQHQSSAGRAEGVVDSDVTATAASPDGPALAAGTSALLRGGCRGHLIGHHASKGLQVGVRLRDLLHCCSRQGWHRYSMLS